MTGIFIRTVSFPLVASWKNIIFETFDYSVVWLVNMLQSLFEII
jgi:hypothetical protein